MKRYYVSHFSGMIKDSEFGEIRDRIIAEGLFDPESGRDHRRVRWPDGRTTDQSFTHLWADRSEAEAFADRLRNGDDDRRWKVFEVDVEGTLEEILNPRNLSLPERPMIVRISAKPYVDLTGEDSLDVMVILDGRTPKADREWIKLEPIYQSIHDTLSREGIKFYPYVNFHLEPNLNKSRTRTLTS